MFAGEQYTYRQKAEGIMEKFIADFIMLYKNSRAKHLDSIYHEKEYFWHRFFRPNIKPSEENIISLELCFQNSFLSEASALKSFHNLVHIMDWSEVVLFLKNKSERLSYQIDYLNYYHTFLAFTLVIFMYLAQNGNPQNWVAVAIISIFIVKIFIDRTNLRRELTIYKEITNLIESKNKRK